MQNFDVSAIGSVGSLVAAALQYAGVNLLSMILDSLQQNDAAVKIGAMLFLFSAMAGLMIIALGGQYKFGSWFLVGPILFYAVIFVRQPVSTVYWQFGERTHDQDLVTKTADGIQTSSNVRLPQVYVLWDRLTSEVVQSAIAVIKLMGKNSDLNFIAGTDRFAALAHPTVEDPTLNTFLNLVTFDPRCLNLMNLKQVAAMKAHMMNPGDLQDQIDKVAHDPITYPGHKNWGYVKALEDRGLVPSGTLPTDPSAKLTCDDLWKLSVKALKPEAQAKVAEIATKGLPDGLTYDDTFKHLTEKFGGADRFANASEDEKIETMLNYVIARMMYNGVNGIRPELAGTFLQKSLQESKEDSTNDGNDATEDISFLNKSYEYVSKGDFLSAMLALPYIQGLGLYFLTITFPFFALVLVVPGRHQTFLMWLGLWFWLKLWDFGFAVVMVLDELLYFLLPHGETLTSDELNDPGTAFKQILHSDPTYAVHTYYNIMATLLMAVPAITALAVKTGGGEVVDALSNGMRNFSGRIAGSMGSYSRALMSTNLLGANELAKVQAGRSAVSLPNVAKTIQNNPILSKAFLAETGQKTMQAAFSSPGLAKQLQTFMANPANKYYKGIFDAALSLEAKKAVAERAISPEMRKNAQHAVMLKWFTHSGFDADVKNMNNAALELEMAYRNYQWGGALGSRQWGANTANAVGNVFKK